MTLRTQTLQVMKR